MNSTIKRVSQLTITFLLYLFVGNVSAATVSGSYGGIIDDDSGLGFLGQTLRADFSYESDTVGTPSGASTMYTGFLESMVVTVGANIWTWDGDADTLFLWDDDVITSGSEDRVQLFVDGFTGPQLVAGPLFGIAFSIYMSDLEPAGAPDGISGDNSLASMAPNPDNFSGTGGVLNQMDLTFTSGALGQFTNNIATSQFSNISPIPLPAAFWLLVSALPLFARTISIKER